MSTIVAVNNVSKSFVLPHQKHDSIKNVFMNSFKGRGGYEKQQVLRDISFRVEEGDFFAIVGRNGSGKSTMLKLLAGIYNPNNGIIDITGKLTPFIELGVGFNPELSGRDNIYLNGALLGFNRKEVSQMYDDIVGFAELERFMDQKLKNYSSGMQVRLAFSIAIRAQSDILLLDEVLAVGDAAFQQKCFDYFGQLKKEGKTVIFVSHDMAAVTRFCTKAIYLKDGELIKQGTPSEIADIYKLENIETPKNQANKGPKLSASHHVEAEVIRQTDSQLELKFSYKSETKDDMYIGFSVLKNGISVAEMTTSPKRPLHGKGTVTYVLDTRTLNPDVYQLTTVLCKTEGRRLLSIGKSPVKFKVEGEEDLMHGAAIRLDDTWKY